MKQAPLDQNCLRLKGVMKQRGASQNIRASRHPEEKMGWRPIPDQMGASELQRRQRSAHGSTHRSVGADAVHNSGGSRGSDLEAATGQSSIGAGRRRAPARWRRPKLRLPPFVALPRRQQARGGEVLLRDIGRVQSRLIPGRRRSSLDLSGRHWSLARKGIEADLEISEARSEKGDLEQGEEEAMKASTVCASLFVKSGSYRGNVGKRRRL